MSSTISLPAVLAAYTLGLFVCCPLPAHAQEAGPSAANRLAAEQLFEAARRDLRAGRTAEACPKLEESQRLDPGIGTLLHLGECYERQGRTASAWSAFREAIPLARASSDNARERLAQERADALFPRLARVVIEIADGPRAAGLVLSLDGAPFPEARWGVSMPTNPGPHRVRAEAPAHHERSFDVVAEAGKTMTLTIPALTRDDAGATAADVGAPAVSPPPAPNERPAPMLLAPAMPPALGRWTTPTLIGAATSGLSLAAGGFFGLRALRAWNASRPFCDADNACDPQGLEAIDRAKGSATIATALLATGAVVGAATAVVVLSASPRQPRVALGPNGVALVVGWR